MRKTRSGVDFLTRNLCDQLVCPLQPDSLLEAVLCRAESLHRWHLLCRGGGHSWHSYNPPCTGWSNPFATRDPPTTERAARLKQVSLPCVSLDGPHYERSNAQKPVMQPEQNCPNLSPNSGSVSATTTLEIVETFGRFARNPFKRPSSNQICT